MENNIPLLLEEYSLGDILEQLDISEEETLEFLLDTGFVTWGELIAGIPLPVTCEIVDTDSDGSEINGYVD